MKICTSDSRVVIPLAFPRFQAWLGPPTAWQIPMDVWMHASLKEESIA